MVERLYAAPILCGARRDLALENSNYEKIEGVVVPDLAENCLIEVTVFFAVLYNVYQFVRDPIFSQGTSWRRRCDSRVC